MSFDIKLRFQPSAAFIGILAELNERYPDWTDGSYDWADQTKDFLHAPAPLPTFDSSLYETPLSQRAVQDLLQMAIAVLAGNYPVVRDYLKAVRYAFVIGYPRSGGSYLTKELLRTIGLDHKCVSESLAHDGFPSLRDTWYDWAGDRPYFHLQGAIFEVAEFLVISNLYYQRKTSKLPSGVWLAPKKMHKIASWAGSMKMLLGQGRADYLLTVRHPLPTCVSAYEKSGGLPKNGRFPVDRPRSAIEHWIRDDLMHLGYTASVIAKMSYFDALLVSWSNYYTKIATSGLFLGDRQEVQVLPYGKDAMEGTVQRYRDEIGNTTPPEPFHIHAKAELHPDWLAKGNDAVRSVSASWSALGLSFPRLSLC